MGGEHARRGVIKEDEGDLKTAKDHYERAAEDNSTFWVKVGDLEERLGNQARARKIWGESMKVYEQNKFYEKAGEMAEKLGDVEAQRRFKALVEVPDIFLFLQGFLYLRQTPAV